MRDKYIQFCCIFYNEHAPEDKLWFGRMFDQCQEEYEKDNSCMFRWQFPLMILKSCQTEIDHLNTMSKRYLGKMQEQQDQIAELKNSLPSDSRGNDDSDW